LTSNIHANLKIKIYYRCKTSTVLLTVLAGFHCLFYKNNEKNTLPCAHGQNKLGKIILTVNQFALIPALIEIPHNYLNVMLHVHVHLCVTFSAAIYNI